MRNPLFIFACVFALGGCDTLSSLIADGGEPDTPGLSNQGSESGQPVSSAGELTNIGKDVLASLLPAAREGIEANRATVLEADDGENAIIVSESDGAPWSDSTGGKIYRAMKKDSSGKFTNHKFSVRAAEGNLSLRTSDFNTFDGNKVESNSLYGWVYLTQKANLRNGQHGMYVCKDQDFSPLILFAIKAVVAPALKWAATRFSESQLQRIYLSSAKNYKAVLVIDAQAPNENDAPLKRVDFILWDKSNTAEFTCASGGYTD